MKPAPRHLAIEMPNGERFEQTSLPTTKGSKPPRGEQRATNDPGILVHSPSSAIQLETTNQKEPNMTHLPAQTGPVSLPNVPPSGEFIITNPMPPSPIRDLPTVAAELQQAINAASRVKALREELAGLLGRTRRAKKAEK